MGAASPPLTALLVVRLHLQPSSAPSPGSQKEPSSGGGERTSTRLAPAVAERGAEEQKTQRRLPFRKRQPTTPQKKTLFPSVSLQRNGRGGPSCSSNPEYQKRTVSTQDWRAWCKQRPLQADPAASILLAGPWFKKVKLKKHVENKTKQNISAAMFHFLYTIHVCLPTVSGKKPL